MGVLPALRRARDAAGSRSWQDTFAIQVQAAGHRWPGAKRWVLGGRRGSRAGLRAAARKGQPGARSASFRHAALDGAQAGAMRRPDAAALEQAACRRWRMPASRVAVGPLSITRPPQHPPPCARFCAIMPRSCEVQQQRHAALAPDRRQVQALGRLDGDVQAVVGSSAMSSSPQASAMASAMRWRWPPENWW